MKQVGSSTLATGVDGSQLPAGKEALHRPRSRDLRSQNRQPLWPYRYGAGFQPNKPYRPVAMSPCVPVPVPVPGLPRPSPPQPILRAQPPYASFQLNSPPRPPHGNPPASPPPASVLLPSPAGASPPPSRRASSPSSPPCPHARLHSWEASLRPPRCSPSPRGPGRRRPVGRLPRRRPQRRLRHVLVAAGRWRAAERKANTG